MRCPGLAGQEKYIQSCARLLMSVNNGRKRSLGPKIYQSPSPNLTLPVDGVLRGLLGELQHKVVLHRYEYKTKNGSSSLWWCASTLKETEIGIWREGSVGKFMCCVSLRNWIQISSTLVKSQAWSAYVETELLELVHPWPRQREKALEFSKRPCLMGVGWHMP